MNHRAVRSTLRLNGPLLAGLALLAVCMGCGEKQDYSGSGDLAKPTASEAPKPTASGAVPTAHAPMKVPSQARPAGQ